jgi:hypothetical protein
MRYNRPVIEKERYEHSSPAKWFIPACALFVFLCGCGKPKTPYQRFVPLPSQPESLKGDAWQGAYALDTKTGQLCVTFDPSASRSGGAVPTCAKLYRDFPD